MKAVFFDLDGTLLGMDNDAFAGIYLPALFKAAFAPAGIPFEKFTEAIFLPIRSMAAHPDPQIHNLQQFYNAMGALLPEADMEVLSGRIDEFYRSPAYDDCIRGTSVREPMKEAVRLLAERGFRIAVCTNPLFPRLAIEKRIAWAQLDIGTFDFVTFAEETHAIKPNPEYYREVLRRCPGLSAADCMMVGNDVEEDMIAATLGMQTYLIRDDMISRHGREKDIALQGSSGDFLRYVKENMK